VALIPGHETDLYWWMVVLRVVLVVIFGCIIIIIIVIAVPIVLTLVDLTSKYCGLAMAIALG
jgi:hypothetical protein